MMSPRAGATSRLLMCVYIYVHLDTGLMGLRLVCYIVRVMNLYAYVKGALQLLSKRYV